VRHRSAWRRAHSVKCLNCMNDKLRARIPQDPRRKNDTPIGNPQLHSPNILPILSSPNVRLAAGLCRICSIVQYYPAYQPRCSGVQKNIAPRPNLFGFCLGNLERFADTDICLWIWIRTTDSRMLTNEENCSATNMTPRSHCANSDQAANSSPTGPPGRTIIHESGPTPSPSCSTSSSLS